MCNSVSTAIKQELLPQVFSSDAAEPKISLDDDLRRCLVTVGDHLHMYIGGHMVVSVPNMHMG